MSSVGYLKILGAVLWVCLSLAPRAVSEPSWLKTAIADIPTSPPHKDATALGLLMSTETRIGEDGHAATHVRWAVKILKSAGTEHGILHQPVLSWSEAKNVKGWLIQADGKKVELTAKDIVRIAASQSAGYYDDAIVLGAAFANAREGSIVAYEYDLDEASPWGCFFQQFVFQVQEPVLQAQFALELPPGWTVQASIDNCSECTYEQNANRHTWTARNLAYRPEEPMAPEWGLLTRSIHVNCVGPTKNKAVCFADWSAAAAWVASILDPAIESDPSLEKLTLELVAPAADAVDKARLIGNFVKSQIRYVAVEIGKGRITPRAAAQTLANRYGDCKDKAALMRAMLKVAGIPSNAVLVAIQEPVALAVTSPFQFDHCIVAIPKSALGNRHELSLATVGEWVLFDPTDPAVAFGRLPSVEYDSRVMVASPETAALTQLPMLPSAEHRRVYRADAVLQPDGSMQAAVTIVDFGLFADLAEHSWATVPESKRLDELRGRFSPSLTNVVLSDYQTDSLTDSAVTRFKIAATNSLLKSGDMFLLKADFIHPDAKPELKAKERENPVNFGDPLLGETSISWRLGNLWTVSLNQEPLYDSCIAGVASCEVTASDTTIEYHSRQVLTGLPLDKSEYETARQFERTLASIRGLRLILNQTDFGGKQ